MGIFKRFRRGVTLLRTLARIADALERLANRHAPEGVEIIFEPDVLHTDDDTLWMREARRALYEEKVGRTLEADEEIPDDFLRDERGH